MGKSKLGMSPITEKVYLGRVKKNGIEWASDKRDVTNNFIDVLHQYVGENEIRNIKHTNGDNHAFFHIVTNDIENIDKTIKYLQKLRSENEGSK